MKTTSQQEPADVTLAVNWRIPHETQCIEYIGRWCGIYFCS